VWEEGTCDLTAMDGMYVCMHVCVCMRTCMYVCMRACACVSVYVYMYVYICTYLVGRPLTGRTHQIRVHLQWLGTVAPLASLPRQQACDSQGCSTQQLRAVEERVCESIYIYMCVCVSVCVYMCMWISACVARRFCGDLPAALSDKPLSGSLSLSLSFFIIWRGRAQASRLPMILFTIIRRGALCWAVVG
jgi:hypothetical protein